VGGSVLIFQGVDRAKRADGGGFVGGHPEAPFVPPRRYDKNQKGQNNDSDRSDPEVPLTYFELRQDPGGYFHRPLELRYSIDEI
jgi:hypothetical protein